jgi:hypothetical protein
VNNGQLNNRNLNSNLNSNVASLNQSTNSLHGTGTDGGYNTAGETSSAGYRTAASSAESSIDDPLHDNALNSGRSSPIDGNANRGPESSLSDDGYCFESDEPDTGFVECPAEDTIFYLPQKPYNVYGTLREQLFYPLPTGEIDEEYLFELLDQVDLRHLATDLDVVQNWDKRLSLGEKQRLAIAR